MIENFKIGIDIVSVNRFEKKPYDNNKSFYKKIFSESEIKYCLSSKNSYERFAGKFALKEAFIKSINEKIHFSEIETSHLNSKPTVKFLKSNKNYKFIASLSHETDFAMAVVIAEKIK
tara:strand:+ start:2225 stop:2578 length:354 start_codon:yes stop_codon:yes gene_type:complete